MLTKEVLELAISHLKDMGKSGAVAVKPGAIISADKYSITRVSKIFGITKATLIS